MDQKSQDILETYFIYKRLIDSIISRLTVPTQIDKKDLESISIIIFLECYKKYNRNKLNKAKFITYLYKSIYYNLLKYINRYKYSVSVRDKKKLDILEIPIENLTYYQKELLGVEFNDHSDLEINLFLKDLTPLQRDTLLKHAIQKKSFSEIGRERGVSKRASCYSYQQALKVFKTKFNPVPALSKGLCVLVNKV